MNNLTIEQMREIVDGAPNGATHVEIIEDEASEYWLLDSETNLWHWHKDPSDQNRAWRIGIPELTVENIHSIENLRTIISQNEEIERLREQRNSLAQIVDNALECAFNGCDYYGADIQEHCLNLGVTESTVFDSSIHADYSAVLEDGDEYHQWSDWFTEIMRETKWKGESDEC